jgi:hypothetical protein
MGAFHSGQDAHTVDLNYDCSIVIADKGAGLEMNGVVRQTTLCGKLVVMPAVIKITTKIPAIDQLWLDNAKHNISRSRVSTITSAVNNSNPIPKYKIDQLGNFHDSYGHFISKTSVKQKQNKSVYYVDSHGSVLTQKDIDNLFADLDKK